MKFEELGLCYEILDALYYMGFEQATPIQQEAIPTILDGDDLIACAQTGTGKTAAFLLPVIDRILENDTKDIKALIVSPTRELAIQIDQQIAGLAYFAPVSSISVYGGGDGADWEKQKKAFKQGVDIVVATPGKLLDHMRWDYADFSKLEFLILDEADRMLDIGFHDDILRIIRNLPEKRQNLMFSATMPKKIRDFAKKILQEPKEINLALSKPAEGVLQAVYLAHDYQKIKLIHSLIANKPKYKSIIIFTSTKKSVKNIVSDLKSRGLAVEGISSNLEQKEREEVLLRFRNRALRVLVATDVISRGIDIKDINLVINFDVPNDAEDYVHRVGRTARADTTGVAITFVNEKDMFRFHKIEQLIEQDVHKISPPAELGEGPKWRVNTGKRHGGKKNKKGYSKGKNKR